MRPLKLILLTAITALFTLPVLAAELIMVDQPGCIYCERWDAELSDIYPKTSEGRYAPLRHLDISDISDSPITFVRAVNFTPTFVLVENNREIARIEGYPSEDFFWGLLDMMLRANTDYTGEAQ